MFFTDGLIVTATGMADLVSAPLLTITHDYIISGRPGVCGATVLCARYCPPEQVWDMQQTCLNTILKMISVIKVAAGYWP